VRYKSNRLNIYILEIVGSLGLVIGRKNTLATRPKLKIWSKCTGMYCITIVNATLSHNDRDQPIISTFFKNWQFII